MTAATSVDALRKRTACKTSCKPCMVLEAARMLFKHLLKALKDGRDIDAREQMTYACSLSDFIFMRIIMVFIFKKRKRKKTLLKCLRFSP